LHGWGSQTTSWKIPDGVVLLFLISRVIQVYARVSSRRYVRRQFGKPGIDCRAVKIGHGSRSNVITWNEIMNYNGNQVSERAKYRFIQVRRAKINIMDARKKNYAVAIRSDLPETKQQSAQYN